MALNNCTINSSSVEVTPSQVLGSGVANQVLTTALFISVFYTTVSIIRSYIFRRIFNRMTEKYKRRLKGRYV